LICRGTAPPCDLKQKLFQHEQPFNSHKVAGQLGQLSFTLAEFFGLASFSPKQLPCAPDVRVDIGFLFQIQRRRLFGARYRKIVPMHDFSVEKKKIGPIATKACEFLRVRPNDDQSKARPAQQRTFLTL
jgi:hypothetical protein